MEWPKRFYLLFVLVVCFCLYCSLAVFAEDVVESYTFLPGEKVIKVEDFSSGQLPKDVFFFDGRTEFVKEDGDTWLKAVKTCLRVALPQKLEDLTFDFYFKAQNYPGMEITFGRPYDASVRVGRQDEYVYFSGSCAGKLLPYTYWYKKKCYNDDETVHFSMTINQQKLKIYINRVLVLNAAGFVPKMPEEIRFYFGDNVKNSQMLIKDLRLATHVPDIAGELLKKGKYSSHGIYFDTGSAKLNAEYYHVLKQIAEVLLNNPEIKLLIVGHTDNVGGKELNQRLSLDRAGSVKNFLVTNYNIDPERLSIDGKGDTEPVADNGTPEGRAQNRRVEFIRR